MQPNPLSCEQSQLKEWSSMVHSNDTEFVSQAVKQLTAGIIKSQELLDDLELSQRAVAITQHHDGVSGTEKQHVADDYSLYLNEGVQALTRLLTHAYRLLWLNW